MLEEVSERKPSLLRFYRVLLESSGHQGWWPAQSAFETVVGTVLAQNTNWKNASLAISRLKAAGCLDPERLQTIPHEELADLIRSSGYYNQKARRLKELMKYILHRGAGSLTNLDRIETETLREELLDINGIGPETADSILLYGLNRPVFVVDAYTKRIFARHKFFPFEWDYHRVQFFFTRQLPTDCSLYNDFHAQIVNAGAKWCRKKPKCEECPLAIFTKNIRLA